MEDLPTPRDLRGVAAVAQTLAYVVGLVGVVAGGFAVRDGETALGLALWGVAFAAGALMMIAGIVVRALSAVLARIARLESDVAVLTADAAARRGSRPPSRH